MSIEGLKISIPGTVVLSLVQARVTDRRHRADLYDQQIKTLGEADIDMGTASNDVKARAVENAKTCRKEADEFEFTAKYIDIKETFILGQYDLIRLGVVKDR